MKTFKNYCFILFLAFMSIDTTFAQFSIGLQGGFGRSWGENVQNQFKNCYSTGIRMMYFNSGLFQPIVDLEFSRLPLKNGYYLQNYFQGTADPTITTLQLTASTFVKIRQNDLSSSGFMGGLGMTNFYNNQIKFKGTVNGLASNGPIFYPNMEVSEWLPFLQLSYAGNKKIHKHIIFQLQIGVQYFLKQSINNVSYSYYDPYSNQYELDVDGKIQPFRPFVKLCLLYSVPSKNAEKLIIE